MGARWGGGDTECRGSEHQRLYLDCAPLSILWFVLVCAHMYVCPYLCLLSIQIDRNVWLLLSMSSGQGEEGAVGRGVGNELVAWDLLLYPSTKHSLSTSVHKLQ